MSPRSMEYYSWTNTGVPEPEAWDMDDELVVIQASQGVKEKFGPQMLTMVVKLQLGLYHKAAPQAVAAFKKGINDKLFTDCKLSRPSGHSIYLNCKPSGETLPNIPVEWKHAPLEGRVGMEPIAKDAFEVSPYNLRISLHEENADLMAPGGETKAGYSVFMRLLDGGLGAAKKIARFSREDIPVTLTLKPRSR